MKNINIFCFFIFLLFFGCVSDSDRTSEKIGEEFIETKEQQEDIQKKVATLVFYDMFSPVEMSSLFFKSGIDYNFKIINPTENADNYLRSSKIATNLGVYGVDLFYNRMFNQTQQSLQYLACIQQLSEKLDIPRDFFSFTEEQIEQKINDKDSLYIIAGEAYDSANDFLKKNNRGGAASLIVLGGWIESLYIVTNASNEFSVELMELIATQKYSLNSLINLLRNNQDDLTVAKYLILLKKLNKTFSQFEIMYKHGDVNIDTIQKRIVINKQHVEVTREQIIKIKSIVNAIRADIVG
ncbi:MAG: hypothetical protein DRJ01_02960 [Bacteroidetes bacterium]|nr:MAG: hypothetical protein DRJ01_02960 [Bacteroidota bacterium]